MLSKQDSYSQDLCEENEEDTWNPHLRLHELDMKSINLPIRTLVTSGVSIGSGGGIGAAGPV